MDYIENSIKSAGEDIKYSTSVCNHSFYFDNNCKVSSHVNKFCSTAVLLTVF